MSLRNWTDRELEHWIIETGDEVIQKEATQGTGALTPLERLIYCLWVADYGMRNAGDLMTAADVYAEFQEEAATLAGELGLARTHHAFAMPTEDLEEQYFDLLCGVVEEIVIKRGTGVD